MLLVGDRNGYLLVRNFAATFPRSKPVTLWQHFLQAGGRSTPTNVVKAHKLTVYD